MEKVKTNEAVIKTSIQSLKPFEDYPFSIHEDDSMDELVSSIKEFGIMTPLMVLPADDGRFEIISGHRRKRAAELAGISEIPIIIKHLSRDEAIITMVDSNIHRKEILPSEKSKAYAMKYEAIKRRKGRPTIEESEGREKGKSRDLASVGTGDSARTVERYIKLGNLIPELMDMVDTKRMGITPAYELSFLSPEDQKTALISIETEGTPSLSQAQKIHRLSSDGLINEDSVFEVMKVQKKPESFNVVIPMEKFKKYFPKAASPKDIEEKLLSLLEKIYQQQIAKKHNQER